MPEGEDSFGLSFRTEPAAVAVAVPVAVAAPTAVAAIATAPIKKTGAGTSNFTCEICNVTTTCQEQLQSHYNGQKHQKKLKRLTGGVASVEEVQDGSNGGFNEGSIRGDCSVYRTPSGHYYCPVCNISMNAELQFRQHMQSKSHLKKAAQKVA